MASIRIHQDIYNFERKRSGFTTKQWTAIICACVAGAGMAAFTVYALRIDAVFGMVLTVVVAAPFIIVGFVPIQRMPAEKYFEKKSEMAERGNAISWRGAGPADAECLLSKDYLKACKDPCQENEVHEELVDAFDRIIESNEAFEQAGMPAVEVGVLYGCN